MNKIFIYARPCVNNITCSAVFFVPFPKYPKIDGNDKKLSRLFLEFSFVLATQTNSKSGEDVSQIIEPEWFVEKSAVETDIYLEKDHKLVCVGKYPICIKSPPFLTFVLYPTKQVNCKVSLTAKNHILFFCYRRTFRLKQENFSRKNKTNYTRRHKFITHKNNCCQVFSRSRNDQPLFVNEYKVNVGWQSSSLKNKFSGFRRAKHTHLLRKPKPYSTTSYEHVSIFTLGGL